MFCRSCRSARRFSSSASSFCCACASCRCNSSGSGSVCSSSIDSTADARGQTLSAPAAPKEAVRLPAPMSPRHAPTPPVSRRIALHRGERRKKGIQFRGAASFCACACLLSAKYRARHARWRAYTAQTGGKAPACTRGASASHRAPDSAKEPPGCFPSAPAKAPGFRVLLFQLLLSSLERLPFGELLR